MTCIARSTPAPSAATSLGCAPSVPALRWLGRVALTLVLIAGLAGCNSRANPMNWFGNETVIVRTDEAGPEPTVNPLVPRNTGGLFRFNDDPAYTGTLVTEVTELRVDQIQGGAVIQATGIAGSLGAFQPILVPVPGRSDDVLRFELRARQAQSTAGQGTEAARRVTAAISLTDQTLAFVRVIEVAGLQNERSVRR